MPPVYGPFRQSIVCNHREPAAAPLVSDAQGRYSMDYAAIEAQLKAGSRCVFLCNPHNPVSRAWSREELQRLLNLCLAYQAVLVSDEIHADFVYQPNHFVSALTLEGNEQCVLALGRRQQNLQCARSSAGHGRVPQRPAACRPERRGRVRGHHQRQQLRPARYAGGVYRM